MVEYAEYGSMETEVDVQVVEPDRGYGLGGVVFTLEERLNVTVETFDEVRILSLPEIVANAILDASEHGIYVPMHDRSLSQIATSIVENFTAIADAMHEDDDEDARTLHERAVYWTSNFLIVGIF